MSVCRQCGAEIIWVGPLRRFGWLAKGEHPNELGRASPEGAQEPAGGIAAAATPRTPNGKLMPCDAGLHPYWRDAEGKGRVVTADGEVLACSWTGSGPASGLGYVPHWATCNRPRPDREKKIEQMRIY